MPHIFSIKTIPLIVYPTYAEYINFALGFMAVDLPWLNKLLPESMISPYDQTPYGFFFYFNNMNFAAMSLITLSIFLFLYAIAYLVYYLSTQKVYP